jgi:pyruvate/2-oxoglutarate dehydrogenase complex dihydrolipoamide acyltransferase (E2) component
VAVAAAAVLIGAGQAGAESLELSSVRSTEVAIAMPIVAKGAEVGRDSLFVYVDAEGAACAPTPLAEAEETFETGRLTPVDGETLGVGAFTRTYPFTPRSDDQYEVCGYLDFSLQDVPDVIASYGFSVPEGPVPTPPLGPEGEEELKRMAEQHEQELIAERAEREARERAARAPLPTTIASPEAPVQAPAPAPAQHCVVPSLRGHSLPRARALLREAHCTLGGVKVTRGARGRRVVIAQRVRRGVLLAAGAAVAVVLGSPRR